MTNTARHLSKLVLTQMRSAQGGSEGFPEEAVTLLLTISLVRLEERLEVEAVVANLIYLNNYLGPSMEEEVVVAGLLNRPEVQILRLPSVLAFWIPAKERRAK